MICLVALLVLGPDKLPEVSRNLGRFMGQMRRSLDEIKREISLPTLGDVMDDDPLPPGEEARAPVEKTCDSIEEGGRQGRFMGGAEEDE